MQKNAYNRGIKEFDRKYDRDGITSGYIGDCYCYIFEDETAKGWPCKGWKEKSTKRIVLQCKSGESGGFETVIDTRVCFNVSLEDFTVKSIGIYTTRCSGDTLHPVEVKTYVGCPSQYEFEADIKNFCGKLDDAFKEAVSKSYHPEYDYEYYDKSVLLYKRTPDVLIGKVAN